MGHLSNGHRVEPPLYHHQESALGNSLLSQQGNTGNAPFGHQIPVMADVSPNLPPTLHPQPFDIPRGNDTFGKLRDENRQPNSPPTHLTNIAEAKLPASFDSNGYSYMAMYGPVAASVPAKFGVGSPPHSFNTKANAPNDALRNLHDSAFPHPGSRANLGSSPSSTVAEPPTTRIMHSQRVSKPKMISSSLPRPPFHHDDYSDDNGSDGAGEEYVPNVLSDLLNPEERQRRSSGKVEDPIAIRSALAGDAHTPTDVSKWGSPSAASPSRFAAMFSKQKRTDEPNGGSGGFSHAIGSAFRSGSSHLSPNLRPIQRPPGGSDYASPFGVSSPPRQSSTSILSQQLKRMHLGSGNDASVGGGSSPNLHPPMTIRHTSNPRSSFERAVSGSGVHASRIDEEQEFVFTLDDEEDMGMSRSPWGHQKSPLGSVGDGRRGLSGPGADTKKNVGCNNIPQP